MTRRTCSRMAIATAALVALVAAPGSGVTADMREREVEQALLQRVVAQTTRSGIGIRATRDLRAGTLSGKHEAWMRVDTTLTPNGRFDWTVLEEGGSGRTRDKVFRAVLESEADSMREDERAATAITPENYRFEPLGSGSSGNVQIRLIPRREDRRLVDGVLTVSADGYPVRLEGVLAKSPSFWVKSVRVVRQYQRLAGVALPTVVESTADLKMFGKSRFTMRYDYREVNGRRFASTHATASNQ